RARTTVLLGRVLTDLKRSIGGRGFLLTWNCRFMVPIRIGACSPGNLVKPLYVRCLLSTTIAQRYLLRLHGEFLQDRIVDREFFLWSLQAFVRIGHQQRDLCALRRFRESCEKLLAALQKGPALAIACIKFEQFRVQFGAPYSIRKILVQ